MGSPSPSSSQQAVGGWGRGTDGDSLLVRRLAQEVLEPLPPEGVTENLALWRRAVKAGAELSQHVRCGHVSLLQAISRLTEGRQSRDGEEGGEEGYAWSDALEECGKSFVENCAEIVEACQGTPPSLAPRILGCAIRLAETLGSTGPLLHAIDAELRCLEDRFRKLEQLYSVSLRRAEAIAGQMPILEDKVAQATKGREELRSQCRELKQVLSKAEKRRQLAETKATELAKELREVQQQQQQQMLQSQGSPSQPSSPMQGTPSTVEAISMARRRREAWQGTRVVNSGASLVGHMSQWNAMAGHTPSIYSSEGPTTARSLPPSRVYGLGGDDSKLDARDEFLMVGRGGSSGSARTGRFGSGASRWSLPASYSASLPPPAVPTPVPSGRPPPWVSRPLSSESLEDPGQSEMPTTMGGSASVPGRGTSFAAPGVGMESISSTPRSPDEAGATGSMAGGAAAIAAAAARAAAASSVPVIDSNSSSHDGGPGRLQTNYPGTGSSAGGLGLKSSGCGGSEDVGLHGEAQQQQQLHQQEHQLHHHLLPSLSGLSQSGPSHGLNSAALTGSPSGASLTGLSYGAGAPPPPHSSSTSRDISSSVGAGLGSRLLKTNTTGTTIHSNEAGTAAAAASGAATTPSYPPAASEPPGVAFFYGAGEAARNSVRGGDVWGMDGGPVTSSPTFMPPSKSLPVGAALYDRFSVQMEALPPPALPGRYGSSKYGGASNSDEGAVAASGPLAITSGTDHQLHQQSHLDALDCGHAAAQRLPHHDPLAGTARSAYAHLASLVEEAFEKYPGLSRPFVGDQLDLDRPAEGLKEAAMAIKLWASPSSNLAAANAAMAGSICTSVAHLETLTSLMSRTSATQSRPSQVNGRPPAFSTKF